MKFEQLDLKNLQDEVILEEAAKRLCRIYLRRHGEAFTYGAFEFIFHDGKFQGIESRARARVYLSPDRLRIMDGGKVQ